MQFGKKDLDIIFERNLKWRLLKRAFTSAEGIKVLVNIFRYYDVTNTGKISKDNWITALLSNGLLIGISKDELSSLFDKYKEENSDMIDYKKFSFDLFFNPSKISLKKINLNNNNYYSQTEAMVNSKSFNNNAFLNINQETPVSKSQNILNFSNNVNNSFPLIKTNTSKNYGNIRYNYYNKSFNNNNYNNNISGIDYNGSHANSIKNSINYFKSKININNGLNYYRFIAQLKSKCSTENKIPKSFLPIALQSAGVFYTQNELLKYFSALGCDEISINNFSLSKIIELIKDEMSEYRKNIVIDAFNNIRNKLKNNSNLIPLNTLKEIFKPEMHPEVLNKKRTSNDIYMQFNETLDIFVNLNNIINNINLDQFIDYYSGISPSIYNDSYFSHIINNVWPNKENNNEYNNGNNINKTNISKNSSMPKIVYDKLNIDNLNVKYNQNEINNLNDNNNNLNKERINNSNAKINLPLFYYQNYGGLSKSNNYNENNEYYQNNSNNNVLTAISNKEQYQNQLQNIDHNNLDDIRNTSSKRNKINDNLLNKDLNLISSNESTNNIDITPIINKLREIFILRGIKSIFYFQRMLYVYDINHAGEISYTHLQNIIQTYNYNFSNEELKNLFHFYDKNNTGYVKYNNLFMEIFGNIDIMRYTLVKQLFDSFPKNQKGNIDIDVIKNSFCSSKHYDVINGNKTNDEVYGEFLECLEIFKEYSNNLNGGISKNELTYEEFCEFFGEMSFEIQNDYSFSNFVQNCWKIN